MKEIKEIQPKGYYVFESLASGNSCYFESEQEIEIYVSLFKRYISKFVKVHKMYLSAEGYQISLKVRGTGVLIKEYEKLCGKRRKEAKSEFLEEPWKIVSEQIRVFHSVYVKKVNAIRGRKGVLVQRNYTRYSFESVEEYELYMEKMDQKEEIVPQERERYRVKKSWVEQVKWDIVRGVRFVERLMDKAFQDFVGRDFINNTLSLHTKKHNTLIST